MKYICIGKIVNTHGIKGELKVSSYSDFDSVRYKKGNTVYIKVDQEYIPFTIAGFRTHKGFSLISFEGYPNINDVEQYKNCEIYIDKSMRKPLKKGEYYWDQFKGLQAFDDAHNRIGKVLQMESTNGAQNNLRIEKEDGTQVLIPYIPEFIGQIDMDEGTIVIHPQKGLL